MKNNTIKPRITFVGAGNMANALIGGLLTKGWSTDLIHAIDPMPSQREHIAKTFGVSTFDSAQAMLAEHAPNIWVLAVKPQQMANVAKQLGQLLAATQTGSNPLIISIAAGIRLNDLQRWLAAPARMVRTMPNTPALIGRGITGLFAHVSCSEEDKLIADTVLQSAGETVWVDHEHQLDAITAISGSGPAYVFYFMEALANAAIDLGFSEKQARQLANATFTGSSALAAASPEPLSLLRERVTSKGGTTAAALQAMASAGLPEGIAKGVQAAAQRAQELGDEFGTAG